MDALEHRDDEIAIIGMTGRFPGAANLDAFWRNLRDGVESVSFFSDDELVDAGVDPAALTDLHYVKAKAVLENIDLFDADFFDFSPKEAELIDPQQRIFLECAWEVLEHAGYDSQAYTGRIGVYAGTSMNSYFLFNLFSNRALIESVGAVQIAAGNDKDYLSTRVSYKLNLKGPSITVQTACSTSLVAVHLACESLLNGECDMALAGGVSISVPQKTGYWYQEGGIVSPDGHCRAFDAQAQGTIFSSGVGIVALKRLEDALVDGDQIHAVVKGSAINNDGTLKVGFTAPSVDGQAAVIAAAQFIAGVAPETIGYVEAHGTGTPLGDPIEVAALTQVFRAHTTRTGFCALGSVKTNIGHLDAAAGVVGLIKAVLALQHRQLPPSLHFRTPNPQIDFAASPFYVNTALADWPAGDTPRRAAVSAFGIGGTNAHVILEEAAPLLARSSTRSRYLLLLSAKTPAALDHATIQLAAYLRAHPEANLPDVAYTLHAGRRAFDHRRVLVCEDSADAVAALDPLDPQRVLSGAPVATSDTVVFLFPGQGAQYVGMGRELYEHEPVFREQVDRCCELLASHLGCDLRDVLFFDERRTTNDERDTQTGRPGDTEIRNEANTQSSVLSPQSSFPNPLDQTWLTQPALFVVEYAMAQLWMSWGVMPAALLGHSLGELVAACLAGVFTLEDALLLVALRGRLMQQTPEGAMVVVATTEAALRPLLAAELDLAAINGPEQCVVAGPAAALAALTEQLTTMQISWQPARSHHAFHSAQMAAVVEPFVAAVARVRRQPPQIPLISNMSGDWATAAELTSAAYWGQQLRQPVQFAAGVQTLLATGAPVWLEVGPGQSLSSLVRPQVIARGVQVLSSGQHPQRRESELAALLTTVGRLWLAGVKIAGAALYGSEARRRVALPTYPFERQRYWIAPDERMPNDLAPAAPRYKPNLADWFYLPSWKRSAHPRPPRSGEQRRWLVFVDRYGLGTQLAHRLADVGHEVICVRDGAGFDRSTCGSYTINLDCGADYAALLNDLREREQFPTQIVHLASITSSGPAHEHAELAQDAHHAAYRRVLLLAQALTEAVPDALLQIMIVSDHIHEVTGEELVAPEKALLLALSSAIPHDYPNIACRCIDIVLPEPESSRATTLIDHLIAEAGARTPQPMIAYRGEHRWAQTFEPLRLEHDGEPLRSLRSEGVYLLTAGMASCGTALADDLLQTFHARLVLIEGTNRSPHDQWRRWRADHDLHAASEPERQLVQALKVRGGEVLIVQADLTDQQQLRAVVEQTVERFGRLDGVIHATAQRSSQSDSPSVAKPPADACIAPLRDTLAELGVLREVLGGRILDFCLVCFSGDTTTDGSVISSCTQVCATTANKPTATPWISVSWEAEFAATAESSAPAQAALTDKERVEVFKRIIALAGESYIVVAPADPRVRSNHQPTNLASPYALLAVPTNSAASSLHPRPQLPAAYVAPRNTVEQTVAQVWQALLGIEQIGIHDNFLELGGHSLLATQLLSRLRSIFQVDLPMRRLFETPTVAGLAESIETFRQVAAVSQAPSLRAITRQEHLPLSFAQERLWFLDQLEPGSPYHIPAAVRLSGPLDLLALTHALNAITRRHEALRTSFAAVDGRPIQVIAPDLILALPMVDLRAIAAAAQEAEVLRCAASMAQRPFDLARGPLVRAMIVRLAETEHVLFLTMHHTISDEWSITVVMREVGAFYEAARMRQPAQLPALPIQYADFAIWQRQWLQGDRLDAQLAYWKAQLADARHVLELPTDRPRPKLQTFRGMTHSILLPSSLIDALRALSQSAGLTLFMTLLAAFQTLLYRYTRQDSISVGTPIANRNRIEIEGLIGFFVNTLVLRADLSGALTFPALLQQVREVCLAAYAHQDLPFEKLVEHLQPERDLSRNPLFQVMFALQNIPTSALQVAGLTFAPVRVPNETAKFDLSLDMVEIEHGLLTAVEYNTDLFDATTISRMLEHVQTLLAGIVIYPDCRLADIPLLPAAERQQLLVTWNDTRAEVPRNAGIHQLFEAQARHVPDAVAVVFDGPTPNPQPPTPNPQCLTYHELNRRANQLAHHLLRRGVVRDTCVAIFLQRSPAMVIAVLATLKAGAAYVPLDAEYAGARLAFVLEDALVTLLLTEERLINNLSARAVQVVCLDSQWPIIAAACVANPNQMVGDMSLAYVVYTSGSTGQPKGVMISHGSLVNAYVGWEQAYALSSVGTCHLQMASFSFDVCAGDVVRALCSGARLVVCPRAVLLDPQSLYALMWRERVDCAEFVPAVLRNVIQYLQQTGQSLDFMRLLVAGSDSWYMGEYAEIRSLCGPKTRLINSYGLSEATIDSTYFESITADLPADTLVPLGRPFANIQLYLLDHDLQPVPIGIAAELFIGGAGLARGYMNRPDLTAERFLPNPFAADTETRRPGGTETGRHGDTETGDNSHHSAFCILHSAFGTRLYRTGDRARYLQNGTVEFLGRVDDQVKIRGFRIEVGEIEAALSHHPLVREVAVLARADQPGNKRLVAYVVPNSEFRIQNSEAGSRKPDAADHADQHADPSAILHSAFSILHFDTLRAFLHERLPDYMVPSAFVLLERLPLTPNGKLDRRALPVPAEGSATHSYAAPTNPTERTIVELWQTLFGVERIGIHDDFFALGGHSLLAPQFIFQLREVLNVDFPLRALFETPTVAEIARAVDALMRGDRAALPVAPLGVDLEADAQLDPSIIPAHTAFAGLTEPAAIFLTGATGFVGAYLLHDLLRQTYAQVYCLVRAADVQAGQHMIRANLEAYLLWDERFSSRIVPVPGDLAQPLLGLAQQTFASLAAQIDSIYHSAAWVNFTYPYHMLRPANVLGTQEILRLAAQAKVKPVHYISTLSVFAPSSSATAHLIDEDAPLDNSAGLLEGYAQSKWVAEKLLIAARTRGIPVCIYRPGLITGHTQTGICHTKDMVWAIIKSCIQLGAVPDRELALDLAPVDFISGAICHLSRQPASLNKTFHLFNRHTLLFSDVVGWLRVIGYPLRALPYQQWQAALHQAVKGPNGNALSPFISLFSSQLGDEQLLQQSLQFDDRNTSAGLARTMIACPPINETLLATYFSYFVRSGFIAAPALATVTHGA